MINQIENRLLFLEKAIYKKNRISNIVYKTYFDKIVSLKKLLFSILIIMFFLIIYQYFYNILENEIFIGFIIIYVFYCWISNLCLLVDEYIFLLILKEKKIC